MRFSVVVPVLNRREQVRACLDTIWAAVRSYGDAELIIVDNGSTDGTWEMLQKEFARQSTLRQVPDVRIGKLRNVGARLSSGDVLSFIDSDCLIGPDYFHEARAVLESTSAAATGYMYDLPPSAHWIEETWQNLNYNRNEGPVTFICSGNLVVRKQAFDAVHGFDETLETGEDAEFCKRLVEAGDNIYQSRRVSAIHLRNVDSLTAFFQKQVWYGLGMFGTFRRSRLDKPVLMTIAHAGLILAAIINLVLSPMGIACRIVVAALCLLAVPTATTLYRFVRRGAPYRPIRSILLYQLYFVGRIWALLKIAVGQVR
jgi:glycosyltransferase involved in cell wall biosynthesis